MNEKECCSRICDLRMAVNIYSRFLTDRNSCFFGCDTTKVLLIKSKNEIKRLEELIYNQELEGDQDEQL